MIKRKSLFVVLLFVILLSLIHTPITIETNDDEDFRLMSSSYFPTKIFPGDRNVNLTVTIQNNGTDSADDAKAELKLPWWITPSYEGATVYRCGDIEVDDVVTMSFYIDISDDTYSPRQYDLQLEIDHSQGEKNISIPIKISAKALFAFVRMEPDTLRAGDNDVNVKLWIRNDAEEKAEEVTVELVGHGISGKVVDYLGIIEPNETVAAFFEVDIDVDTPIGNHTMELYIMWSQYDRALSDSLDFQVKIIGPYSISIPGIETSEPLTMIIIGILGIITIGASVLVIKRIPKIREKIKKKLFSTSE